MVSKTGIDGLDDILGGGIPSNRTIVVQGGPGTGKSTLALQYLVNGVKLFQEPGILVSMEVDRNDIINDSISFGWDIRTLVDHDKLAIITPPGGFEDPKDIDIDTIINLIAKTTSKIGAKRLVIDSLNSLEISVGEAMERRELLRFITLLRDLDCTTILTSEVYDQSSNSMYSFMAHGVIQLYNLRQGASRLRAVEIRKMRGVSHSNMTHSLNISPTEGIIVLPHEIDLGL